MVLGVLTDAEKLKLGWYDGCQTTVWALGMIVQIHSSYIMFSELEQACKQPTTIHKRLTPGIFINLFYLPNPRTKHGRCHTKTIKYCPLSTTTFVLKLIFLVIQGHLRVLIWI